MDPSFPVLVCPSDIPTFPAWTGHSSVDIPKSLPFVCNCVWVEVCVQTSFFQTRGTLETPPTYQSLCCASRGSLIQHPLELYRTENWNPTPTPAPSMLIYIPHPDWTEPGLSFTILPRTMVGGGAQIGSSPTRWLFLSSQLSIILGDGYRYDFIQPRRLNLGLVSLILRAETIASICDLNTFLSSFLDLPLCWLPLKGPFPSSMQCGLAHIFLFK